MKKLLALVPFFASASNAFAATGREDHSGILVWVFLGFCALIIVAQAIPALLVLFGLAKGIAGKPELAEEKASSAKPST